MSIAGNSLDMADQAKFQKILEVLLMLDGNYGRTISELSDHFDMSKRTVYRYFETFKQVASIMINCIQFDFRGIPFK